MEHLLDSIVNNLGKNHIQRLTDAPVRKVLISPDFRRFAQKKRALFTNALRQFTRVDRVSGAFPTLHILAISELGEYFQGIHDYWHVLHSTLHDASPPWLGPDLAAAASHDLAGKVR